MNITDRTTASDEEFRARLKSFEKGTPVAPDPLSVLDQLDEAHAKATPGEWYRDAERPVVMYSNDGGGWPGVGFAYAPADAALIVAAVNAAPALVTIVREWWDEHDGRTCVDRTGRSLHGDEPCATRAFIARTLAGER